MALFKRFRTKKHTFSAALAPDEPFFAVGDLHGREDLLCRLLPQLTAAAPTPETRLICVGDYIDRGENSLGVLRRLQALQRDAGDQVVCLRGNHEEMLLDVLEDPATGPRWLRHGGLQTMASLKLATPPATAPARDWEAVALRLREALGGELITWLRGLPLSWQSGNVAVVHAGADPERPIDDQAPDTLTWGHPRFEKQPRRDGLWVVHGHTIQPEPVARDGRIAIDTGAYATGRLTAALIERDGVRFLTA